MTTALSAPPTYDDVQVVVPAPGPGAGNWAGAASAVLVDGVFWLTWRVRRPLTDGRGVSVVVARSDDGLTFEPVTEVARESFGAESFERPVLVPLREGGWRLYLSCATPDSKHWWVDSLTADTPAGLPVGVRRRVHEGDAATAVKDPVIRHDGERWHLWASVHPLDDPGATDRMTTEHATSADGVDWTWQGTALTGTPGTWDARGVRFTAVVLDGRRGWALYDGRATAGADAVARSRAAAERLHGIGAVVVDCESGPLRMGLAARLAEHLGAEHVPVGEVSADVLAGTVRERVA